MYRPYSIYAPPFDPTSGGIRVMYGLYGHLLAKGQIAAINSIYSDMDFIAIYPEIVTGNPFGAKHIVRYIMNKPGVMGGTTANGQFIPGPTEFDKPDQLYYFSRLFGEGNYLFLPILNLFLFKDQGKKRTKTAYFIGKGKDEGLHPMDAYQINRAFARDQQALADLLNECEVLYCYDPVTAMTELARLCGCRIVMVNPVYSKDQFKLYEPGMNGISWGKDEEIPLDIEGFRKHYYEMKWEFGVKLNTFIEVTQQHAD